MSKKILIVEDSKPYLWLMSQEFEKAGFEVITAEDGEQGLKAVQEEKPNLVLLDISMPKMDGITMARKAKELNINVPIIFLTNLSDVKYISEATEMATEYIVKSDVNIDEIVRRVKQKLKIE